MDYKKTGSLFFLMVVKAMINSKELTCGNTNYDPDTQICCSGVHQKRQQGKERHCCTGTGELYDIGTQICCGQHIHPIEEGRFCCNGTMHDNTQKKLVCCGTAVYYQGIGICCNESFTKRIGNARMECRNGKGVPKSERTLNLPEASGVQLRELGTQEVLRAKTCQNDIMVDEYLPQGSAVKPGTLVLDGVELCGQVVYPRESSTTRYYCCDAVLHETPHLDPNANYTMECCGTELHNTSSSVCCGGKLLKTSLQPVDCCNNAVEYTTSFQICCGGSVVNKNEHLCGKPTSSSPGTPVPKEAVDHNATCYDYKTSKFKTYNTVNHMCVEGRLMSHEAFVGLITSMISKHNQTDVIIKGNQTNEIFIKGNQTNGAIVKDNQKNPTGQLRHSPSTCRFTECDSGIYNRTSECIKRKRLDYFLHTTSNRNGGLVLYGVITFPPNHAGTLLRLQTENGCKRRCFEAGILYSIYTNRFTKRFPSKSRLSKQDIVVKKHKKSFSCTIDPWAKHHKV